MTQAKVESGLNTLEHPQIAPASLVTDNGVEYGLAPNDGTPLLVVRAPEAALLQSFEGDISEHEGQTLLVGPCNTQNAAALRARLPWLLPRPLGLQTSAGLGDRLGLATPGH